MKTKKQIRNEVEKKEKKFSKDLYFYRLTLVIGLKEVLNVKDTLRNILSKAKPVSFDYKQVKLKERFLKWKHLNK